MLDRVDPDPADRLATLLRYIVHRRRAKLANSWREGLIAAARGQCPPTKNTARQLIADTAFPAVQLQSHLRELSLQALGHLVDAVVSSLDALDSLPGAKDGEPVPCT